MAAAAPISLRCALCHDRLLGAAQSCGGCGTRLHLDCQALLGGRCPTLGCAGTSRACSACARMISILGRRCTACGADHHGKCLRWRGACAACDVQDVLPAVRDWDGIDVLPALVALGLGAVAGPLAVLHVLLAAIGP